MFDFLKDVFVAAKDRFVTGINKVDKYFVKKLGNAHPSLAKAYTNMKEGISSVVNNLELGAEVLLCNLFSKLTLFGQVVVGLPALIVVGAAKLILSTAFVVAHVAVFALTLVTYALSKLVKYAYKLFMGVLRANIAKKIYAFVKLWLVRIAYAIYPPAALLLFVVL